MPKQTARKCTGGAAPYNLMAARVKKFAGAAGAAGSAGAGDAGEDDASRDLSVSSAGLDEEEFKVYSMTELQTKTKEELVQLVLRLQNSLQDLLEAEDDDDEEYGMGQQDELDEEDDDGEDFNESNVTGGNGQGVVALDDDDDDEDEDDDEGEDGDADNGDVNGDVSAGAAADSDVSNDVTGSKDQN